MNDFKPNAKQLQRIQRIQRDMGMVMKEAILGNGSNPSVVFDPDEPGNVLVRYEGGNREGWPQSVRPPMLATSYAPETPVWVTYDADGELAVWGPRVSAQRTAGQNILANQVQNDPTGKFLDLALAAPLLSHPDSPPSMNVVVRALVYIDGSDFVVFPGQVVDLTSYIPADPGEQCLALVYLDRATNTILVEASTPISAAEGKAAFDTTDFQECLTAAGADIVPSKYWQLVSGMTAVTDENAVHDMRQWLTGGTGGGGGTGELTGDQQQMIWMGVV